MTYEKTFTFDDGFNFEHAVYHQDYGFVSAYARDQEVEPNNKAHIKRAAEGKVNYSYDSHYTYYNPILLMADGSLFIQRNAADKPEHRGRYTFGKCDFSIISTGSNDLYAQYAFKHMAYNENTDIPLDQRPKLNAAAFNQAGSSIQSQSLLIDHVGDQVYCLEGRLVESTADGFYPVQSYKNLPDKIRQAYNWRGYFKAVGSRMITQSAIRLTRPRTGKLLDERYKAVTSACVAWFKLNNLQNSHSEGVRLRDDFIQSGRSAAPDMKSWHLSHTFTYKEICEMNFSELHPYQRWLIATNSAQKPAQRATHWVYALRFNSQSFFDELASV